MEMKEALILDGSEPLSRAIGGVLENNTAVIIAKNGKYFGIIDDRNLNMSGDSPTKTKCETVAIKPPVISPESTLWERTEAFLSGRFKALPVVDAKQKPLGIITRVEVLKELKELGAIPNISVKTLMNSPVFTIDEKATVSDAKKIMKEEDAKRLIVTRNGRPVGIFSTLDIAVFALKPVQSRWRERGVVDSRTAREGDTISRFFRPDMLTIEEHNTVKEATDYMIKREVSYLVVLKDSKPVGILSALDIFKWLKDKLTEELPVEISGLGVETRGQYGQIKDEMTKAVSKFVKKFGITGMTVHVKETKSFFSVKAHVIAREMFVVSAEGSTLEETVSMVAAELKKVFGRRKGIEESRKIRVKRRLG
ncbi:MAG: CBS domain-containing protein [Candidatus Micrarchaeota archaeon]